MQKKAAKVKFMAVIPARYASTRLPGKPLLNLGGKPMVIRVAEQAIRSGAEEVWIATDHPEVFAAVKTYGFAALMTKENHQNGTERLAEVIEKRGWDDDTIVVNIQGDEPLIDPDLIVKTAEALANSQADIATVAHRITNPADLYNPAIVKVACNKNGNALLFSRAPIPFARDSFSTTQMPERLPEDFEAYRHVGLYAYRSRFLKDYTQLSASTAEKSEALEQLRALWHGYQIHVTISEHLPAPGVDTPEDAEKMQAYFANMTPTNT